MMIETIPFVIVVLKINLLSIYRIPYNICCSTVMKVHWLEGKYVKEKRYFCEHSYSDSECLNAAPISVCTALYQLNWSRKWLLKPDVCPLRDQVHVTGHSSLSWENLGSLAHFEYETVNSGHFTEEIYFLVEFLDFQGLLKSGQHIEYFHKIHSPCSISMDTILWQKF
jgi:hypothetical protein